MSTKVPNQVSPYAMRVWDTEDGSKLGVSIGGTEYLTIGKDQLSDLITDLTKGQEMLGRQDIEYSKRVLKAIDWVESQIEDYGRVVGVQYPTKDTEEILNLKALLSLGKSELHRIVQKVGANGT